MSHFKESLSPLFYTSFKEKMKIVIDAGAHSFKIGFAGDNLPRSVFPPIGFGVKINSRALNLTAFNYYIIKVKLVIIFTRIHMLVTRHLIVILVSH